MTKRTHKFLKLVSAKKTDYLLPIIAVILTIFGVLMVYDASVAEAFRDFSDKLFYARLQARWAIVGIVAMLVSAKLPLAVIRKLALPFFALTLILLAAVLIPGIGEEVQGARRWINLGRLTIQPSELVKLSFVLYLATWLEKRQKIWPFLFISTVILGLVMAQPDLGTSVVVLATGIIMYFISGAPLVILGLTSAAGILGGAGLIMLSPYRLKRLQTFFDPTIDPLGSSYHIRQILLALGSGGWLGVGIGKSRQKYQYLPEAATDSIFAVMAEEVGFLGSAFIIGLFILLIYRGFTIARRAPTAYTQLLAGGLTAWIGVQTFINLASMVALVPLTGVPLPFISYGGSSLVTLLTAVGLLVNISRLKS